MSTVYAHQKVYTVNCFALRKVVVILSCQEGVAVASDNALNISNETVNDQIFVVGSGNLPAIDIEE